MPGFAANISFMFTELPFLERFGAAAAAGTGFSGVEFHYLFEFDPSDVRLRLEQHGPTPVLMNIRAGETSKGEWGFAGLQGRHEPGTGEIDFTRVFAEIDGLTCAGKHAGWVSAEYRPSPEKDTKETLVWLGS